MARYCPKHKMEYMLVCRKCLDERYPDGIPEGVEQD